MNDSSDDEPLAFRKSKLVNKENGQSAGKASDKGKATQETDKSSGQPASDSEADYKTTQEERNTEPEPKKKAPAARRPAAAKGNGGTKAAIGKGADASQGTTKADKPTPVKRERKVFELPGQRRDTPDEMDPLRKFYSSLKEQKAESLMARNWLCIHGLLSVEEAEAHLKETGKAGLSSPGPPAGRRSKPARPRVSAPRRLPANPPAARKSAKGKREREDSEAEATFDDDDDDDDEEFMAKRKPAAKRAPPAKPAARKRVNRDVAFDDGGLDSDSDDDKPLAFRKAS